MTRIVPLNEIPGQIPRLGKISAGYMDAKTVNGKTVTFPVKSRTLVFRTNDRRVLDDIQKIVGGQVSKSPNPKVEGLWRLVSQAAEIDALMTTDAARYEAWGASGKIRDCDGHTCKRRIDPKTGETHENEPCWCAQQHFQADSRDACRLTTRINLFVPAFADIPGVGIWQIETRGLTTFQDFKGFHELFTSMHIPSIVGAPVTVRVEIVKTRSPQGDTWEFPVFRFRTKLSFNDMLARAKSFAQSTDVAALPAPDDSTPPLGAGLTPEEESLSNAAPITDARTHGDTPAAAAAPAQPTPDDPQTGTSPTVTDSAAAGATPPATPATSPAAEDQEPDTASNEELEALTSLIVQAARASGFTGQRFAARWLKEHYGIETVDALTPTLRAHVRADCMRICTNGPSVPAPTEAGNGHPTASATNGNGASNPRAGLVAKLLETLEQHHEPLEWRAAMALEFTRGRTDQIDRMTEAELQSFLAHYQPAVP